MIYIFHQVKSISTDVQLAVTRRKLRVDQLSYANMNDTILNFATLAHKGQFRKNGKEYITHLIAVAEKAIELSEVEQTPITDEVIIATALLHDVLEDTKYTIEDVNDILFSAGFTSAQRFDIRVALSLLTKPANMSSLLIVDYTLAIKRNPLARIVKLADIDHNCSDLEEGNLKQKYLLQRHILCQ